MIKKTNTMTPGRIIAITAFLLFILILSACSYNKRIEALNQETDINKKNIERLDQSSTAIEARIMELDSRMNTLTKETETNRGAMIKIGTEFKVLQDQALELNRVLVEIDSLNARILSLNNRVNSQKDMLDFNTERVTTVYDEVLDNSIRVVALQKEIKTLFEKGEPGKQKTPVPQAMLPLLEEKKPMVHTPPPVSSTPITNINQTYEQAMRLLDSYKYYQSIALFDQILNEFPNHDLAVNALYWKAEGYYSAGELVTAIVHFQEVVSKYSGTEKAADALTKIGMSYIKLGDPTRAKVVLDQIRKLYPAYVRQHIADGLLRQIK